MTDVWSKIYRRNIWNGVESKSGPGSGDAATRHVRLGIEALVKRLDIRSVLDVGCGDGYWMPDLPDYVGIDKAPEAVAAAQRRHPDRTYILGDVTDYDHADLIIIRDVIQHLSVPAGLALVRHALARCEWLLASSYAGGVNSGISPAERLKGRAYDNDLTAEPFLLGPPHDSIFDGYSYHGDSIRDGRKILGLWYSPQTRLPWAP